MYLECSPFLEKERDGGGPIALMCPFVAFLILPLVSRKMPFCYNALYSGVPGSDPHLELVLSGTSSVS